ncbi:sugar ABC transporter substrate-binding protein [Pseudonocardia benzenivorans]|uniref:Sugar ABC transporter substrate-binding protein n=1 Tax=Pseudonocardia benzenivorans TaxID=228005 RepID=A0ABW3VUV0_9PSEU
MKTRISRGVVAAVLAVTALTACSTGAPTGGGTADTGTAASSLTADAERELQATIDQYRAVPTFTPPGPAIDVTSLRGKKIYIIPETNNVFNTVNVAAMQDVAQRAGVEVTVFPNQGNTSQWVQGMQTAVSQKVDLIVLANAPDPRALQPQLAAAKAANIPVVVTHFYDDSTTPAPNCEGCAAGVTALETAPFDTAAKLLADWVILQGKGNVNALIPIVGAVIPSPGMQAAIKGEFDKYCPKCTYKFVDISLADFASAKLATDIQASLSGDPKINWVIDQLDSMESATVSAINTAGRSGQIQIVGYNGATSSIKDVQSGTSPMVMDVGESAPWIGYSTMDQAFRVLLGQPVVKASAPVRVFDSTNAKDAGDPPALTQGYGDAYVAGYEKLWGLS